MLTEHSEWLNCLSMKLIFVFNSIISPDVHWHEILIVDLIPDLQYFGISRYIYLRNFECQNNVKTINI